MLTVSQYNAFFEEATKGHAPLPWQRRLALEPWPDLVDIPTGLGKTAGVGVAWLARRCFDPAETSRRLIWCLPVRALVEQTRHSFDAWIERTAARFESRGVEPPSVHVLMGGESDAPWDIEPERPAVIIGTQDMLLSRALNRGYAMSRYRWPVHYGLLNNDVTWVLDETQLMGVGLTTSAQLDGLRRALGTQGPTHTIWMSATLHDGALNTVDHRPPANGWKTTTLNDDDRSVAVVGRRIGAGKRLRVVDDLPSRSSKELAAWCERVAGLARESARTGELSLVVVNRVERAQGVYAALRNGLGDDESVETALIHSRFRAVDRAQHEAVLLSPPPTGATRRIVVATQAIEAGLDVSAATLITELAPWPSLVQRMGRCNRYGDIDDAKVFVLDNADDEHAPYDAEDLEAARELLRALPASGDHVEGGPAALATLSWTPPPRIVPVIRRRDVLDLFDTSADLTGVDLDVSPWIRDTTDSDVFMGWADWEGARPPDDLAPPAPDWLVRVPVYRARDLVTKLARARKAASTSTARDAVGAVWQRDRLEGCWIEARAADVRPGMILVLPARAGGYDDTLGYTGDLKRQVGRTEEASAPTMTEGDFGSDPRAALGRWVPLEAHLTHVRDHADRLAQHLSLTDTLAAALSAAAAWHDVGKAHTVFQSMLTATDTERAGELWAKSAHRGGRAERPRFRHELASALAWWACGPEHEERELVAWLIATHHGKVRLAVHPVDGEREPRDGRPFARGVWEGDILPAVELPDGTSTPEITLTVAPFALGEGSWTERMVRLRDRADLGPFRLAWLEAVMRAADAVASAEEVS